MFLDGELETTDYEIREESPNGRILFVTGDATRAKTWAHEHRLQSGEAIFIIENSKKIIRQYYKKVD